MNNPDKLTMRTPSLADANFAALAALFPNAVTEMVDENGAVVRAIDKDVLTQEINAHVVEGREERYQFTWPDKRKSILLANAPIAAALRPCRGESVDFDDTENLYIEGDNLDVLKLLRETYLNRVKMIYIDPPYNTGHDFVYEDDFAEDVGDFLRRDGQYDEQGNRLAPNLDSNGRFHTDWLNMIYPRLRVARDLLTQDGVIFISIDDNEVENLKKVCNEVFGSENFIAQLVWQKRKGGGNDTAYVGVDHEYILLYAKSINSQTKEWRIAYDDEYLKRYSQEDEVGRYYYDTLSRPGLKSPIIYDVVCPDGSVIKNGTWQISKETFDTGMLTGEVCFVENKSGGYTVMRKVRMPQGRVFRSILTEVSNKNSADEMQEIFESKKTFTTPKPTKLICSFMELCTEQDSLVLDFFSGSATTAHAVMQLNAEDGGKRKFIMVQLPEVCDEKSEAAKAGYANICEIGKERIRRAGAKIKADSPLTAGSLDVGFRVLKLDSSNMKDVYYTPDEYAQMNFSFDGLADNIKEDRTGEDLLFQVLLDLGIPLSSKITQDGDVYYINDNYLIACFKRVDTALIAKIAKQKPYYAVFRDSSFASDSAMVNFEQVFATYSPGTIRRVL
jgi:adenine-specific DNA-methyltransferase